MSASVYTLFTCARKSHKINKFSLAMFPRRPGSSRRKWTAS